MKWQDISDKSVLGVQDEKARRVLNTSNKPANITAEEIEKGVSIESLESLNVPVYRYKTQITIHGVLPDIGNELVNGYKSIIQNGNGTCGVRYIAVDGAKKAIVRRVARCVKEPVMNCYKDSQGVQLNKRMCIQDREQAKRDAIALLKDIPDLFIGCKYLACDMYGALHVVAEFEAIPVGNLWEFVKWYSGGIISDLATLERLEAEKAAKDEIRQAAEDVKYEKEREQDKRKEEEAIAPLVEILKSAGYVHYEGSWKPGKLVMVKEVDYSGHYGFKAYEYAEYGKTYKFRTTKSKTLAFTFGEQWKHKGKYSSGKVSGWVLPVQAVQAAAKTIEPARKAYPRWIIAQFGHCKECACDLTGKRSAYYPKTKRILCEKCGNLVA